MSEEHIQYRVVVLGAGSVGKSALTIRLVTDNFLAEYDPTIEDSYRKLATVDGDGAQLDVLDTAGQDDFVTMQEQWIREGQGFLLVYSITSKSTLDHVCSLREKVIRTKNSTKVPMVLVGNKCDLEQERAVTTDEGQSIATKWGIPFFECSAKKRINHEECFYAVVREIRKFKAEANQKERVKKPFSIRCSIL